MSWCGNIGELGRRVFGLGGFRADILKIQTFLVVYDEAPLLGGDHVDECPVILDT